VAVDASPGAGRVLIALSHGPLVAEPTWTRFDNITLCRNYGYNCFAGRQTELDTTDTGTATVYFHDQNRTLDDSDLVGRQIMLQLYNPYTAAWQPRWRGHIDDINRNLVNVPNAPLADCSISAVGIFDYLGGVRMLPGIFGDAFPAGMSTAGQVFYEDERVDDRFFALLTDANLASTMIVVFTGNVFVNETLYDISDVILQACRDAADAEFPGIANFYEDRYGRACFHGRHARFDPEATAASASNWNFQRFAGATREDISTVAAEVKDFSYNRPRTRVINSYLAYPRADENGVAFKQSLIPSLVRTDSGSITTYGYHSEEAPDLIVQKEYPGSGGHTGAQLCGLFGDFYVGNYAGVRLAVESVVFQSCPPGDARAQKTWKLMTECDVADAIHLTIDEAGLADTPFFVDGVGIECRPLNPSYDLVTFTPNLTPASYYGTDVFDT
jgi:hypothetical protein